MSQVSTLDQLCINTIRTLSIDAVQRADSGHPGLPLGAAPMAYVLWRRHLRHDPAAPDWPDRDRFVLSAGHGSMLLYSLLHLFGYDVTLDDLRSFRQWGSKTPGHPEFGHTPGVEATTGPLGQGTASSVGMALAERWLAARYNRPEHAIVDHRTFALVSDGDLMEGIATEAASLAGHLRLGKLVWLYDANDVSLDGPLELVFSEDVVQRFQALGWGTWVVADGDRDLEGIDRALAEATSDAERPSLIVVRTTIGYGSPNKAGTSDAHGSPLGEDEVVRTKRALGWESEEPFWVPAATAEAFGDTQKRGAERSAAWRARFAAWERENPELAEEWRQALAGELPRGWDGALPQFETGSKVATRAAGGKVMSAIAGRLPWLMGGDADLSGSTKTKLDAPSFDERTPHGRNVHFGVREHAMGGIANGMAYHGGVRPFTATFFVFSDYMRPSMRLAALAGLPVVHVFTHDSVAVGEDGPTHQPVEHLMALRAMPNTHVVRPADATETSEAWRYALLRKEGPTTIVLSRQGVPTIDRTKLAPAAGLHRGAYVLSEAQGELRVVLIATGAEVALALTAQAALAADGIGARVVSMPCHEAFAAQDASYREEVLPPSVEARVSIEAGATLGWERWIGSRGASIGIDHFGASAPGDELLERFGFTSERVVAAARAALEATVGA